MALTAQAMRSGRDWEREILRAVGSCQVFVDLRSNPYSHSPWCGREWTAFTRRRCWSRTTRERTATNAAVWWLAREVEDKFQEYWVEPEISASHHVLTDMFSAGAA
ncbi:toll/interleukin-1 receptor domain-containing protein [Actinospica durhamensis]|uniref:Toll/interleukin-1 receptor domain-containing protein n=2 Tax=Actinospica durhamensis TaxID=1508375 RepID=A0A941EMS1_9ACTN|nr:toll/interleukin-1 receptor domain-containing protein [Actinospica durhamensis]